MERGGSAQRPPLWFQRQVKDTSGQRGSTCVLSHNTDLSSTNELIPLATNVMGSTPWFYLDMDSPVSLRWFCEAVLKPQAVTSGGGFGWAGLCPGPCFWRG